MKTGGTCSRREALGRLAGLFAAGLWPGALRAAATGTKVGEFTFVVANDFHHDSSECDPWFTALFRQIAGHAGVEFCLGLGDLANKGKKESIATIARLAREAGLQFHAVPGNHDNDADLTTSVYEQVLPGQLNYTFSREGWRFVFLDSTEGNKWGQTKVQPATLAWLAAELPKLDPRAPTILCTHFPLAAAVKMCPLNAEDVLQRFEHFNLQLVLGGHFHGQTLTRRGQTELTTNVCCGRVVGNHDGTTFKGYWLCRARADGTVGREFVEFRGPTA